jgi:hypothetical protein
MKQVLHECNSRRKPSLHIVDRVRYHVLYKAKMESLREKMQAHRKSISEMGTLIDAQTHSERKASIARLGSFVEEHEEGRRREEEAEGGKRELVKIVEERVSCGGIGVSPSEVLQGIEEDLMAKGGDEEEVNDQMEQIRTAMMLHLEKEGQPGVQGPERLQLERFKF